MVAVVEIYFREHAVIGWILLAEPVFIFFRRFEPDQRKPMFLHELKYWLVQCIAVSPIFLEQLFKRHFRKLVVIPQIEIALGRTAEHLHPHGDFSWEPADQIFEDFQLNPM